MTRPLTVLDDTGRAVALSSRDFVAEGGEGRVYAQGGRAFKLYHDPARALAPAKAALLAQIGDARVLAPTGLLRDPDSGAVVGFEAPFLAGATPLCRLFARAFRDARGVGPEHVHAVLSGLAEVLGRAHALGLAVVDLNPLNVLVADDLRTPYLIDVDSWQAPGFPATAVMDAVRDRHAPPGRFGADTDWFSFAVLAFQLLVGVHPYRGAHPSLKTLDARMLANASAFRPEVTLPPSRLMAPSAIAEPLRAWLVATLDRGERAPLLVSALVAAAPLPTVRPRPRDGVVIALERGRVRLTDAATGRAVPLDLAAGAVAAHPDGRLFALVGAQVVEIRVRALGHELFATTRPLCQALPFATSLHAGLAVQRTPAGAWLFAFPGPGLVHQLRAPELDGYEVVDARLDGQRASFELTGPDGAPRALVVDFDGGWRGYGVAPGVPLDAGLSG
ncbi:MAG: hypothetical protein H6745_32250 [Deltaproteobacteria bacterium]|nr:hypothetical protein [Deltaproteobacteria bacterium]